jgi:hypothetical protein
LKEAVEVKGEGNIDEKMEQGTVKWKGPMFKEQVRRKGSKEKGLCVDDKDYC